MPKSTGVWAAYTLYRAVKMSQLLYSYQMFRTSNAASTLQDGSLMATMWRKRIFVEDSSKVF